MLEYFKKVFQSLFDLLSGLFEWILQGIGELFSYVFTKLFDVIVQALNWLLQTFLWLVDYLYNFVEKHIIELWNAHVNPAISDATQALSDGFSSLASMFPQFPNVGIAFSYFIDLPTVLVAISASFSLLLALLALKIILKLIPTVY